MSKFNLNTRVASIFIHVQDMDRAVHWYAELFGVPITTQSFEKIYSMKFDNLILLFDAHGSDTFHPSERPLFDIPTDNIDQVVTLLNEKNIDIIGEVERFEDISFLTIKDSEGNLFMVVQE
ncbi:VOC family protein [Paenibacillus pini]|uniref:Glyoxalase/fosfomycin resistance/dioxygenase domain-containing protein n=1 Tax=Paenibacillus pini JCM 16418 TaxID=1236976 RepID=W7YDS0_9BACL|nr:VOC family protein [Paenibacillus pini]GAF06597.1 hypothetical protein JCM16418_565 [Paenibacillus pini JCM 16418]